MDFELLRLLAWYAAVFVLLGVLDTLLAGRRLPRQPRRRRVPHGPREFWQRSAFAGFALAAYAFVAAFFALVLFDRKAYWLFGVLMVPYPVLAVYLYNWAYALDDLLEGFKIFLLHHVLPIVVLIAVLVFAFKVDSFVRFVLPA